MQVIVTVFTVIGGLVVLLGLVALVAVIKDVVKWSRSN